MDEKTYFQQQRYSVIGGTDTENKLLQFLKQHYPHTIVGNELKISELKAILGIPFDEKTNGYGLNFVGRNVARAKYAQPTQKALRVNTALSKDMDTTQNLVLKGDNLDSLKILKNHYSGKIKCIYIDPPYNTQSDEFIYPDKFDREEAEVLGIAENLSDEDFARMDFSFKTKKSHNGWLAFMYPRLLLARDLLSTDGVIFISIDDNEQANLKILCDEIFGEENFVGNLPTIMNLKGNQDQFAFAGTHEYTLVYAKSYFNFQPKGFVIEGEDFEFDWQEDDKGYYKQGAGLISTGTNSPREHRPSLWYPIFINGDNIIVPEKKDLDKFYDKETQSFNDEYLYQYIEKMVKAGVGDAILPRVRGREASWRWGADRLRENPNEIIISKTSNGYSLYKKQRPEIGDLPSKKPKTLFYKPEYSSGNGTNELRNIFNVERIFNNPKPISLIKDFLQISTEKNDIILDFFAGSGTTAHAVMQLNAEDGGNRKFILCQIDEPIAENKPAYKFCQDKGLPPVISSITIERLKKAGELITQNANLFNEKIDTGYKVFDSVASPQLSIENENILFPELETDALSRIYNMIFSVGTDAPSQTPQVVQPDSVYRIGNNYYITNSERVSKEDFAQYLSPENRVFVDGWTASLNATLQHYKDEVKIVF